MNGNFQFNPGSATRRNFPKRVITATWAVLTVKKQPKNRHQDEKANNAQYGQAKCLHVVLPSPFGAGTPRNVQGETPK